MLAPGNARINLINHATQSRAFCQNDAMPFDPDKFHRASIRLRGYDYRGIGVYFVTTCTHQGRCIFGRVQGDAMRLNPYGAIAHNSWLQTDATRERVELDEFVVMPNHFHGLLWFTEPPAPLEDEGAPKGLWRSPDSLGSLVGGWKSSVTSQIWESRRKVNWSESQVWLRGYYEHIVRDERELNLIREYIRQNPANWNRDVEWKSEQNPQLP